MGDAKRIEALEARVTALEAVIASMRAIFTGGSADAADDRDLDSARGDEKIRMNPRDWKGPARKGSVMSRCEPEFLDLYAETMDYFASKNADTTKAGYDRKAAARARGWANRIRSGWAPPVAPEASASPFGGPAPRSEFRPSYAQPVDDGGFGDDSPNPFAESDPGEESTSFEFGANVEEEAPL